MKIVKETPLMEQYERERKHLAAQEDGSEEYVASLYRLMDIDKQLASHTEQDSKTALEITKVVVSVALPLIGLVGITAAEKQISFVGSLRDYTKYFLPKKVN
jgi:hypothetical protein